MQIFIKIILVLVFPLICFANKDWNGSEYSKNSKVQQSQAFSLLREIEIKGDENILDIGSGNGKITTDLALLIPGGTLITLH
jgi:trans-aconitate methyltransferase